jgi:hypothetical protein
MFDMRGTGLGGKLTTVRRPTQCRPDTGHKALCPVSIGKSLAHMNTISVIQTRSYSSY